MTGQTKLAHWSPPQCCDHWSVTLNTQELHRRQCWGVFRLYPSKYSAIFGIHVRSIHNTNGEYSQSINMWVYAPDMTPGNGHRTQNRASLCHSPGGWDYTSTAGAWLGLSCEESGETETKRCKYLHNRVFTPKMLALNSKSDQGLFWLELLLVMPINCAGQNVRFWGARMFYAGGNQ